MVEPFISSLQWLEVFDINTISFIANASDLLLWLVYNAIEYDASEL